MRVELAVTNERGKWEEENQRLWQQRQDSLLATAHQEWSKAQESVLQAELERTKKDWEREIEKRKQVRDSVLKEGERDRERVRKRESRDRSSLSILK